MKSETLSIFDKTLTKTDVWLRDLMEWAEAADEREAYRGLRAVLHALRDALPTDEVAQFAAQLPMLIRGLFYEGWDPASSSKRYHKLGDFLARVQKESPGLDESAAIDLAHAVFGVIRSHVDEGEIADVLHALPQNIRALWPDAVVFALDEFPS